MKKSLLILMMALFSAGVLSAQDEDRVHGFSGGAYSENNTTIILGQAFAFQETDGDFELVAGVGEAQLERGFEEVVTLTPDQDFEIPGWGTLTAPVTPGNYSLYVLYTDNNKYDSVSVYMIKILDCEGTVADYDGNSYDVVGVAGYCWTKSNLKPEHYMSGEVIPTALVYDLAPDDDETANLEKFGRLYTWYSAVNVPENSTTDPEEIDGYVQGICPDGWHIPTSEEMEALKAKPAKELKEKNADYWLEPNDNDNATEFSARGAGKAIIGGNPAFMTLRGFTDFWSVEKNESGQAKALELTHFCAEPSYEYISSNLGLSVRCVRTEGYTAPATEEPSDADGE